MAKKKELVVPVEDAPVALVELITHDPLHPRAKKDTWPIASVKGGVDKMTVERKGNTMIIKIVSPEGGSTLDPGGWERPKREWHSRHKPSPKAELS